MADHSHSDDVWGAREGRLHVGSKRISGEIYREADHVSVADVPLLD